MVELQTEQLILRERQDSISPSGKGSCCLSAHLHEDPQRSIGSTKSPTGNSSLTAYLATPSEQRTENIENSKDGKNRSLKTADIHFAFSLCSRLTDSAAIYVIMLQTRHNWSLYAPQRLQKNYEIFRI